MIRSGRALSPSKRWWSIPPTICSMCSALLPNTTPRRVWCARTARRHGQARDLRRSKERSGGDASCASCLGRLRHREGTGGRHRPVARARGGRRQGAALPAATTSRYHRRLADHGQRRQTPGRAPGAPVVPVRQAAARPTDRGVVQAGHRTPAGSIPARCATRSCRTSSRSRWSATARTRARNAGASSTASATGCRFLTTSRRHPDYQRHPSGRARPSRAATWMSCAPTTGLGSRNASTRRSPRSGRSRSHESRQHRCTPSHLPARRRHHHGIVQVLVHPCRPAARAAR